MKWRYLIVSEDYGVVGTNDEAAAREAAQYELVADCEAGKILNDAGSGQDVDIPDADPSPT